jgi:hypothetical protein
MDCNYGENRLNEGPLTLATVGFMLLLLAVALLGRHPLGKNCFKKFCIENFGINNATRGKRKIPLSKLKKMFA